jgi:hypothetical protein
VEESNQNGPRIEENNQPPAQPQVVPSQWQYHSGNLSPNIGTDSPGASHPLATPQEQPVFSSTPEIVESPDSIAWRSTEFISKEKPKSWYVLLALVAIVLAGIIYGLTRDIFSTVIVVVLAIIFGGYAGLRPRTIDYVISSDGISVGKRHFKYDEFRSFSVNEDESEPFAQLLPHKKFMVPVALRFEAKDADKIIKVLGDYLALEDRKSDWVDKIIYKIRF